MLQWCPMFSLCPMHKWCPKVDTIWQCRLDTTMIEENPSPPFPLLDVIFGMPTSLWGSKTTNSKFHSPQNYSSATWWNEGKVIGEWELPHKDWHEGAIKRHIVKRQYIVHKRYSPHQSWDIVVSSYQYLLSLSFVRSQLSDLDFCVIKLDWVGAVWHNLWRYRGIQKIIKSYRWAQI